MKVFVVSLFLIVLARARPDVSHLPSGSYLPIGGSGVGGFESSGSHISSIGGISGIGGLGGIGGVGGLGGIGGIGGLGGIGGIGGIGGYPQDQKHVYFYAAPDDEAYSRLRINVVPNAQRNTKIIFVKAPSYGAVVPEVIAPPSISEDKTLVYVLVKRPEHGGQISIPAGVGVKQAKPEVFFIKYKSQHDAESAIRDGLSGHAAGLPVSEIGSESSFVRTLDSGSHGHGGIGGIGGFTVGGSHGVGSIGIGSGSHGVTVGTGGGLVSGSDRYGPPGISGPY